MSTSTHLGDIPDDHTFTAKRIAALLDRSEDWVLEHIIRPGADDGVRCRKVGTLYFISGEAFRHWVERGDGFHGKSA